MERLARERAKRRQAERAKRERAKRAEAKRVDPWRELRPWLQNEEPRASRVLLLVSAITVVVLVLAIVGVMLGPRLFTDVAQAPLPEVSELPQSAPAEPEPQGLPGVELGSATSVPLATPVGLAVDAAGSAYIADSGHHQVRAVDRSGIMIRVAGGEDEDNGFAGDGNQATSALLDSPWGLAVYDGDLYIADLDNHRVRKVDSSGTITTFAGGGGRGFSGDDGPAILAQLDSPWGIAVDAARNVYIGDSGNDRVRMVDRFGIISTFAGGGGRGPAGDGGPAVSAQLDTPFSITVDALGNVYIADALNGRVRMVAPAGEINTVAGTDAPNSGADDSGPSRG